MRTAAAAISFGILLAGTAAAQDVPAPTTESLSAAFEAEFAAGEALVVELAAMAARDQYLRRTFIARFSQAPSEAVRQAYIDANTHYFDRIDGANTARLKEIMADMSWTELAAISQDAANDAFLIVSHTSDTEFKKAVVAEIEPLVRAGQMDGEDYAMFVDDLLLNETGQQRYGTNFECVQGEWRPQPTEDMEYVDERRAEMGLPPLSAGLEIMRQVYGECPPG